MIVGEQEQNSYYCFSHPWPSFSVVFLCGESGRWKIDDVRLFVTSLVVVFDSLGTPCVISCIVMSLANSLDPLSLHGTVVVGLRIGVSVDDKAA